MIQFRVNENPKPLKRHRMTLNGQVYDPSAKDKTEWLQKAELFRPEAPPSYAIKVTLTFFLKRPKSHFRTGKYSKLLKNTAPEKCIQKPDLDNLVKFVLDAMNGTFYLDDSQIVELTCSKKYSEKEEGYTDVIIMNFDDEKIDDIDLASDSDSSF